MVSIGRGMGKKVAALITGMDQPLGRTVGNALEMRSAIETLKGRGPKDLESLSLELTAWMLSLAGAVAPASTPARTKARDALASGAGLRKFQEVIELQGGDPRVCDDTALLPRARETVDLTAAERRTGRPRIGCRAVGHAGMLLGAGRETVESRIDPAVGVVLHKKVGELVVQGEPLMTVHVERPVAAGARLDLLRRAVIEWDPRRRRPVPLVREVID